jgi:hypothetical protein
MRIGTNPLKKKPQLEPYKRHRIIIPIFIGADHEYFAQSTETLKLCLRSLYATIDLNHVSVTVINNDSVPEVDEILAPYIKSKQIDRYIRNQTNRGKPDAVAGEILATYESFVTLTDCDVLFYPGWMRTLENVYCRFRGVGAVSPFPAPNHQFYHSGTTWLAALLSLRARRGAYVAGDDLDEFLESIGKPRDFFPESVRKNQFGFRSGNETALIGCGHFVVMFRRYVFNHMVYKPKLAGASNGEQDIDAMSEKAGFLRLSTPKYHVYHLGNVLEDWMENAVREVESSNKVELVDDASFGSAMKNVRPIAGWVPRPLRALFLRAVRIGCSLIRR